MRTPRKPFSEEHKLEMKKRNEEHLKRLTPSYQLGFYAGETIIRNNLPTLSVDSIKTNKNISVTCSEGDKYRKLTDIWFNTSHTRDKYEESEKLWNELMEYREFLKGKYIPKKLNCIVRPMYLKDVNISEFKDGIINSLWESDCCCYSLVAEDIIVVSYEETTSVEIILKL